MTRLDEDFAEFADAQIPRLLGLSYTLTGNPHDAWDLVQETLTRVGMRWRRLRVGDPAAYARTVMVRLNIDRLRALRRELPVVQVRDRPAPVVEIAQVDSWLLEMLADLSPRQRTALVLRFVEDLDVAGVAERMGCSIGTAKSHLSRGMKKIRERPEVGADKHSKRASRQ